MLKWILNIENFIQTNQKTMYEHKSIVLIYIYIYIMQQTRQNAYKRLHVAKQIW